MLTNAVGGTSAADRKMSPNTLLPWGCAMRATIAISVLQLAEFRELQVDDEVSRYLPEFGNKVPISLRDLLYEKLSLAPPSAPSTIRYMSYELMQRVWTQPQLSRAFEEADVRWGHRANTWLGWTALSEIVARVSAEPFEAYVERMIFRPLGIDDVWFSLSSENHEALQSRLAIMYDTRELEPRPLPPYLSSMAYEEGWRVLGPRGLIADLGRLYETLLPAGGVALLNESSLLTLTGRFRASAVDMAAFRSSSSVKVDPEEFWLSSRRFGTHCSATTIGFPGHESILAFADRQHGLVVAIGFNGMPGLDRSVSRELRFTRALYEELGLASLSR